MTIDPKEISPGKLHGYLLGSVLPRPIALASTIDNEGHVNLSPFSFFNVFSSNPPVMIFSPSRRGRDSSTKHTYENVKEVPEVVINIVNYSMVEQVSLASCEFPKGINEFVKSGLTPVNSLRVKPPRVLESPVSFECTVKQVIELGTAGAAGNLVICEVIFMHVKDELLDEEGRIDPIKLDAVARMGQDYYCRVVPESIFVVPKPNAKLGIGFDQLPEHVKSSRVFTRNELGRLANIEALPDERSVDEFRKLPQVASARHTGVDALHQLAGQFLKEGKLLEAWKVLLS